MLCTSCLKNYTYKFCLMHNDVKLAIACPLLQNSNRKIQCSKSLFSVQRFHSMFKDSIQCSKIPFNVQRFHSMFKDSIQCSKIPFNVQRFHSMFKNFIQCSKISFKVQRFHSMFNIFIQSSKSLFKVQKVHSKFKMFIQSSKSVFKVQKLLFNLQAQRHNFLPLTASPATKNWRGKVRSKDGGSNYNLQKAQG